MNCDNVVEVEDGGNNEDKGGSKAAERESSFSYSSLLRRTLLLRRMYQHQPGLGDSIERRVPLNDSPLLPGSPAKGVTHRFKGPTWKVKVCVREFRDRLPRISAWDCSTGPPDHA
jgi:hypothetical protein